MRIALVSPAAAGARTGNRHTALRWAAFLRKAGHRVDAGLAWPANPATEAMLALHARRSHVAIRAFREAKPKGHLVVALTGTDVYRDIRDSVEAQESLELADRLIVLQPKAAEELPHRLRGKVRVVVQSCATRLVHRPVSRGFRLSVLGNLRPEKDPLRTAAALQHLPGLAIEVVHLGAPLDPQLEREAQAAMQRDARYRWLASVPHARALRWLASSHAMVISSRMEGGANVVCEALRIGVPVLASDIPGNIGLLGDRYPAYFALEDDVALARLIERAASDRKFYGELKERVGALRDTVDPQNEARELVRCFT